MLFLGQVEGVSSYFELPELRNDKQMSRQGSEEMPGAKQKVNQNWCMLIFNHVALFFKLEHMLCKQNRKIMVTVCC